jgi:tRNA U34 5-methylaminomethyl-2-thiouridine-forming methyltransferase MnmC
MGFELIKTADGSFTVFHPIFNETYHSRTAGAVEESLKKFLYPSGLLQKAKVQDEIAILEIGFGLGYNVAVAVAELWKVNPSLKITYVGLEKELNPLLEKLELPEPYGEVHKAITERVLNGEFNFEWGNLNFKLLSGEARERIKNLKGIEFDSVFHDAFSPKVNCELWTLEFLAEEKRLLKEDGVWVSYSTALPVRRALYELGFYIYNTKPVGRRAPGTLATLKPLVDFNEYIYTLSEKEREKLLKSPKAVPYSDPNLSLPRKKICEDYKSKVGLL